MGGHGALTLALRHPDVFRSVSAFSPIASPIQSPWGQKALGAYLGGDHRRWRDHDACALIEDGEAAGAYDDILVDQGLADPFLADQLKPELLEAVCPSLYSGQRGKRSDKGATSAATDTQPAPTPAPKPAPANTPVAVESGSPVVPDGQPGGSPFIDGQPGGSPFLR